MNRIGSIVVVLVAWLAAAFPSSATGADGIVLNERVNVRTRPSIASEVIKQLNTDDAVKILDRINLNDPQPGEPKNWYRIQIPADTLLWVSTEYIDETTKAVKASRLNVRAGPGQNFSVVGRIERDTVVDVVRQSAGWTAIKPLPTTVAYVAANFVRESSTASADVLLEENPEPVTAEPVQPESTPPTSTDPLPEVIVDEKNATTPSEPAGQLPPPIYQPEETTTTPPTQPTTQEKSLFDSIENPSAEIQESPNNPVEFQPIETAPTETTAPEVTAPQNVPTEVVDRLKRIVTRDGIVKRTRNIQAPTYHRLDDPRTGTTINYLYTGKLQVDLGTGPKALKPYEGRRIRVVGAEAVDARWPRIPVIEVEQLRILE